MLAIFFILKRLSLLINYAIAMHITDIGRSMEQTLNYNYLFCLSSFKLIDIVFYMFNQKNNKIKLKSITLTIYNLPMVWINYLEVVNKTMEINNFY